MYANHIETWFTMVIFLKGKHFTRYMSWENMGIDLYDDVVKGNLPKGCGVDRCGSHRRQRSHTGEWKFIHLSVRCTSRLMSCPLITFNETFYLTGCTNDIMTSDHSPLFATFEVGVASQFVSKQGMITVFDPYADHFMSSALKLHVLFFGLTFQTRTVHLKAEYRSWTVWPPCWQSRRPSSSLNTIPAAWKVRPGSCDWPTSHCNPRFFKNA